MRKVLVRAVVRAAARGYGVGAPRPRSASAATALRAISCVARPASCARGGSADGAHSSGATCSSRASGLGPGSGRDRNRNRGWGSQGKGIG